jgi:hypothetical protein
MSDLAKMTSVQLKRVTGFVIQNEHGRIEFLAPVDLSNGLNLDSLVFIEKRKFELNTQNRASDNLNVPAKVTLYNFPIGDEDKENRNRESCKRMCETIG